jgi:hypothetical protein
MGLETVTKISDLNPLWPTATDGFNQGDDHLRNTKIAVTACVSDSLRYGTAPSKILNGKMDIANRGTSFAAVTSGTETLDQWRYYAAGTSAVGTISQQADAPSTNEFQNSLRFTVTTADAAIAAGDVAAIEQPIEGYFVRDLISRDIVYPFWVRSAKTGTHCVSFANSANDRSYITTYTVNAINTWELKSVTIPSGLITAGTWNWTNGTGLKARFCLAAGSTFQSSAGAWQSGNYLGTSAQVNCLDTIGNIFAVTGVELKAGLFPGAYDHRPITLEQVMCERYLPITDTDSLPAQAVTTTIARVPVSFRTPARVAPTGIFLSAALSNYFVANAGGSLTALTSGALARYTSATGGGMLEATSASAVLVAGNASSLYLNAGAKVLWTGCTLP